MRIVEKLFRNSNQKYACNLILDIDRYCTDIYTTIGVEIFEPCMALICIA